MLECRVILALIDDNFEIINSQKIGTNKSASTISTTVQSNFGLYKWYIHTYLQVLT